MIQSGYNPQGGNLTTTQGQSFGGPMGGVQIPGAPSLPFDPTAALRERLRMEAEQRAFENSMRERQMKMQEAQARQTLAASQPRGSQQFVTGGGGTETKNAPTSTRPNYGPTPASLGRFQMNHTGNWGTFVDPANIPVGLQDKIMGGMYGGSTNWDTSNPSIMGPQQFATQKYTHSGGGGSMASIGQGGEGAKPESDPYEGMSPYERAKIQQTSFRGR